VKRLPIFTLLVTNFISGLGNSMTALAVPWFVLETTGSATRTGLTAAAATIPTVIASFFGGALVDRVSRRGLSIFADAVSALTLAAIPILYTLDALTFPLLLALMFAGAIFDAPGSTARSAMVPVFAERGEIALERVNSAFGINQAISALIGAPIAGILVAAMGATNVLWFAVGAFVISILGMALLVPATQIASGPAENYLAAVKGGVGFVLRNRLLRTMILMSVTINFIFTPIFGIAIPYLAKNEYGSARDLGFLESTLGLGMLGGALLYGAVSQRVSNRMLCLASVFLMGAGLAAMAMIPPLLVACLLMIVVGIATGLVNPLVQTFVQLRTPPDMMGRVLGVLISGAMMASPVGLLIGGGVISGLGLAMTFLLSGAVIGVVFIAGAFSPALRDLDQPPTDGPAGGPVIATPELGTAPIA